MLENYLEKKLVEKMKSLGGVAFKFTSPGLAGVPDRIAIFPGGQIVFVEMKAPGKKLRPLQLKRKKDLEALGCQVEMVDSIQRIEEICSQMRGDPSHD